MSKITSLVVKQWISEEWDKVEFNDNFRKRPEEHFYLFTISAYTLKKLTGVYRRNINLPPAEDLGVQRRHIPERSREILRYIQEGFPLSRISKKSLVNREEEHELRMPGWIPTAIIVNILTPDDVRGANHKHVNEDDLVKIEYDGKSSTAEIVLPESVNSPDWAPLIYPIEVIDGQHRLWAFEEMKDDLWSEETREKLNKIEIPVVAFKGLEATWRAYLFYTINQLPKRVDPSLVFDLYPLLRTQEWLLRFEGPEIYRQTRAQQLATYLWSYPESPWFNRIDRLGDRKKGQVSQSSFIRSLMASFIKSYHNPKFKIGGLFGSLKKEHETVLSWSQHQQAAFLILIWQKVKNAVVEAEGNWIQFLRELNTGDNNPFSGEFSFLATDQGVRGVLSVCNDICWLAYEDNIIDFDSWDWSMPVELEDDNEYIKDALSSLNENLPQLVDLIAKISESLSSFDWRIPSILSSNDSQFNIQSLYRGAPGYKNIRRNLLNHLTHSEYQVIKDLANNVLGLLQYEQESDE